jgi:hypothetical protein
MGAANQRLYEDETHYRLARLNGGISLTSHNPGVAFRRQAATRYKRFMVAMYLEVRMVFSPATSSLEIAQRQSGLCE